MPTREEVRNARQKLENEHHVNMSVDGVTSIMTPTATPPHIPEGVAPGEEYILVGVSNLFIVRQKKWPTNVDGVVVVYEEGDAADAYRKPSAA